MTIQEAVLELESIFEEAKAEAEVEVNGPQDYGIMMSFPEDAVWDFLAKFQKSIEKEQVANM